MTAYLIRRLLQAIPTLLGITIISFAIMQAAPGDPVQLLTFNPDTTEASREKLRQQLCLDRSLPEQYLIWVFGDFRGECQMRGLIRGDFGTSFYEKRPVLEMIAERIPATLELSAAALGSLRRPAPTPKRIRFPTVRRWNGERAFSPGLSSAATTVIKRRPSGCSTICCEPRWKICRPKWII